MIYYKFYKIIRVIVPFIIMMIILSSVRFIYTHIKKRIMFCKSVNNGLNSKGYWNIPSIHGNRSKMSTSLTSSTTDYQNGFYIRPLIPQI